MRLATARRIAFILMIGTNAIANFILRKIWGPPKESMIDYTIGDKRCVD